MKNKYKDNENVYIKKYKTNGRIIESSRYFKEVNSITDEFKEDGHAVIENTLADFRTPYKIIGDTLIVDMGKGCSALDVPSKMKYKAQDVVYTVDILNRGSVVFFENELSRA
jgi:hypothetical protein